MIDDQIKEWVLSNPQQKNKWFESRRLKIYLRISQRHFIKPPCGHHLSDMPKHTVLDIGSVEAVNQGKGVFTRLLEELETMKLLDGLYIENVLTPRFQAFWERRGYLLASDDSFSKCYYQLWLKD